VSFSYRHQRGLVENDESDEGERQKVTFNHFEKREVEEVFLS